ncbi:cytochrome c oxidase assembly protein [Streptomyces arenae]|nr:cytochrome c oxidase assembly protein [Streptomyces arenae]
MTLAHVHPGAVPGTAESVTAVGALLAAFAYAAAAGRLRRRGDAWPRRRDAVFALGSAGVAWAAAGGLPGGPFGRHVIQHVIVGMAAPLLLVLARPLTLVLRSLGPGRVRRVLTALARSSPVGVLLFPPFAALLDVGGLWVLYRTDLFAAMRDRPLMAAVVHAHMLAAGLLFTFAVCGLDPVRRRWGLAVRGGTLLAAGAAHGALAKSLYAAPPAPGITPADLHGGAQWMYYGGDAVEVALAVVLGVSWYAAAERARARRLRRTSSAHATGYLPVATGAQGYPVLPEHGSQPRRPSWASTPSNSKESPSNSRCAPGGNST